MSAFEIRFPLRAEGEELATKQSEASKLQKFCRFSRNYGLIVGASTLTVGLASICVIATLISANKIAPGLSNRVKGIVFCAGLLSGVPLVAVSIIGIAFTALKAKESNRVIDILNTEKDYTEEEMHNVILILKRSFYWTGDPANQSLLSNSEKRVLTDIYNQWNAFVIQQIIASDALQRGKLADATESHAFKMVQYAHLLHDIHPQMIRDEYQTNLNFMVRQVNQFSAR